jgi:transcriptional regulator with XRE-family HTH domain
LPKRSPGARERGLGLELRRIREERGLGQREAADQLHWGKDRLSRIETGKQNITVEDVAQMLGAYGVDEDERESLLEAARSVDEPGWWERIPGITRNSAALADYESEAAELIDWSPGLIPGLLQTMDYAAAVMELYGISHDLIGARIGARRERQRAVAGKPYTAYIGMSALRATVGGPRVMAAQLDSLVERNDVTIRVAPEIATHLGQVGAFYLLRFPGAPSVVHVELLGSGVFHDTPELTSLYDLAVTQIAAVALSETESARLIKQVREETRADHEHAGPLAQEQP